MFILRCAAGFVVVLGTTVRLQCQRHDGTDIAGSWATVGDVSIGFVGDDGVELAWCGWWQVRVGGCRRVVFGYCEGM